MKAALLALVLFVPAPDYPPETVTQADLVGDWLYNCGDDCQYVYRLLPDGKLACWGVAASVLEYRTMGLWTIKDGVVEVEEKFSSGGTCCTTFRAGKLRGKVYLAQVYFDGSWKHLTPMKDHRKARR